MSKKEEGIKLNTVTDVLGNPIQEFEELPDTEEFFMSEQDEAGEIELSKLTFEQVRLVIHGLQGKVLTVIDATFDDQNRLKYVKDLVREAFSSQTNWLFEISMKGLELGSEAKKK